MRGPEYVLEKAQTRYRSVWRDALLGADPGVYSRGARPALRLRDHCPRR